MKLQIPRVPVFEEAPMKIIIFLMRVQIFFLILFHIRSVRKAKEVATKIDREITQYLGPNGMQKLVRVGNRFYWDMYDEGWPSKIFNQNIRLECDRIVSPTSPEVGMRNVLFGITTKCSFQCEHCYEWNLLNTEEKLSFTDLQMIVEKVIHHGASQIHFGGGEPMKRFHEIVALLQSYSNQAGFWIATSGYHLTEVRARELKDAGLTGVCVSLDHHEEMMHNYFRHHAQAYTMAKEAVAACREAGLVTGLSLCATKEFVSEENLNAYLELAKEWGVAFIQILEPRAVGHYQGKDVNLSADQKRMLENTFIKVNTNFSFRAYPIIIYHEFYQATLGCRGGGKGSFYIDPQGEVHPCPFCRRSEGNLLYDSVEKCVDNLLKSGCPMVIPEAEKIDKSGKDELEVVLTN